MASGKQSPLLDECRVANLPGSLAGFVLHCNARFLEGTIAWDTRPTQASLFGQEGKGGAQHTFRHTKSHLKTSLSAAV